MAANLARSAYPDWRGAIAAEARGWLGVRFQHQGRSESGIDCAGLVIIVGKSAGALPKELDVTAYSRRPDGKSMLERCREHLEEIPLSELDVGDVALFSIGSYKQPPQHLAVIGDHPSGELSMIHAYAPARKVVENRIDTVWRSLIVAGFRYRAPGCV